VKGRRRPWLAGLLGLFHPPLGALYNARPLKLVGWHVAEMLLTVSSLWLITVLPAPPLNLLPALIAFLGVHILGGVDALSEALRFRDVPRPWYGRWYSCLGYLILHVTVLGPASVVVIRDSCVEAFRVPNGGMENTILIGDHVVANKAAYGWRLPFGSSVLLGRRLPARRDVIVFRYPLDRRRVFIKRVIGLPGEEVEVREKTVYIDGRALDEPYAFFGADNFGGGHTGCPLQKVPADSLFLLGDNRDNSSDSRTWGFVPIDDVRGRASVIYFSREMRREGFLSPATDRAAHSGSIRWSRIGRRIE
jgi:signal peptidase I